MNIPPGDLSAFFNNSIGGLKSSGIGQKFGKDVPSKGQTAGLLAVLISVIADTIQRTGAEGKATLEISYGPERAGSRLILESSANTQAYLQLLATVAQGGINPSLFTANDKVSEANPDEASSEATSPPPPEETKPTV